MDTLPNMLQGIIYFLLVVFLFGAPFFIFALAGALLMKYEEHASIHPTSVAGCATCEGRDIAASTGLPL